MSTKSKLRGAEGIMHDCITISLSHRELLAGCLSQTDSDQESTYSQKAIPSVAIWDSSSTVISGQACRILALDILCISSAHHQV